MEEDLISGVGLDVFDSELPAETDERILKHPKISATIHYAWYSENSLDELQKRAAENLIVLLDNQPIEDSFLA